MTTATRKKKETVLTPLPRDCTLLSLDVSSTAIGWAMFRKGLVADFGLIAAPKHWDSRRRIAHNTDLLVDVSEDTYPIDRYAVMEWQSHKRSAQCPNASGLAVLGQAQGEARRALADACFFRSIDLISERDWTKQGGRNVSKETRFQQVKLLCPAYYEKFDENPSWDGGLDVCDAISLGFWRLSIRNDLTQ